MFMVRRTVIAIAQAVVDAFHKEAILSALNRTSDLASALAAEKAVNAELRSSLAQSRANFDWLRVKVNELNLERAELYRRVGFVVPVAEIARETPAPTSLPGADDNYAPNPQAKRADIGDLMAKARELHDAARRGPVPAGLGALDGAVSFEDMGDDAADALGIGHTPAGELEYAKR